MVKRILTYTSNTYFLINEWIKLFIDTVVPIILMIIFASYVINSCNHQPILNSQKAGSSVVMGVK